MPTKDIRLLSDEELKSQALVRALQDKRFEQKRKDSQWPPAIQGIRRDPPKPK